MFFVSYIAIKKLCDIGWRKNTIQKRLYLANNPLRLRYSELTILTQVRNAPVRLLLQTAFDNDRFPVGTKLKLMNVKLGAMNLLRMIITSRSMIAQACFDGMIIIMALHKMRCKRKAGTLIEPRFIAHHASTD